MLKKTIHLAVGALLALLLATTLALSTASPALARGGGGGGHASGHASEGHASEGHTSGEAVTYHAPAPEHSSFTTYHGGYPATGTREYDNLVKDKLYGPNYTYPLSVWYHMPYPHGYVMVNGELQQQDNSDDSTVLLVLLGVCVLAAGGLFFVATR